jgi:hypothetical protein
VSAPFCRIYRDGAAAEMGNGLPLRKLRFSTIRLPHVRNGMGIRSDTVPHGIASIAAMRDGLTGRRNA